MQPQIVAIGEGLDIDKLYIFKALMGSGRGHTLLSVNTLFNDISDLLTLWYASEFSKFDIIYWASKFRKGLIQTLI